MFNQFLQLYNTKSYMCVQELPLNGRCTGSFCVPIKEIMENDYNNKENVFFSPNTFGFRYDKISKKSTCKRDREHLQTLECLYVDIDLKDTDMDMIPTISEAMEYFQIHNINTEVPEPTMITCSGHGIHMYWKINSVTYKGNLDKWDAVQKYIYEVFERFGADRAVTNDRTRILRMPGTINRKEDKEETECYVINYSGRVYELDAIMEEYNIIIDKVIKPDFANGKVKSTGQKAARIIPFNQGAVASIYTKRVSDLTWLLNQRDKRKGAGMRENTFFLLRYFLLELGCGKEETLYKLKQINNTLAYPLSERELAFATKSAEGYSDGDKLNWRNAKIIEFLSITKDEMKYMKTIMDNEERCRRTKERDRQRYLASLSMQGKEIKADAIMKRRIDVYELYMTRKTAKEICRLLEISKSTCYEDLAVVKTQEWQEACRQWQAERVEEENILPATGTDGSMVESGGSMKNAFPKNSAPIIYKRSVLGGHSDRPMQGSLFSSIDIDVGG